MPKNSSFRDQNYEQSKMSYARQPIHRTAENKKAIDEEEEEEENMIKMLQTEPTLQQSLPGEAYLKKKPLYPDINEDLCAVRRQRKSNDPGKGHRTPEFQQFQASSNQVQFQKLVNSEKLDSHINSTPIFKYIISILLFIAAAIGVVLYNTSKTLSVNINVKDVVADMQTHFQEQQSLTFKLLERSLAKVVIDKPEPRAPAIFTIIANKGAEKTASDFSIHLAKALARDQFVYINDSVHWHNDPEYLKLKIDKEIKSKLEKEILNVVVVDRLNDIPIDAAMIFHAFCDHEFAPYKRAVYLFIVHLTRSIPKDSNSQYIDTVAMESLRNIWLKSTDDVVDSLITRITVNVVNIR